MTGNAIHIVDLSENYWSNQKFVIQMGFEIYLWKHHMWILPIFTLAQFVISTCILRALILFCWICRVFFFFSPDVVIQSGILCFVSLLRLYDRCVFVCTYIMYMCLCMCKCTSVHRVKHKTIVTNNAYKCMQIIPFILV